MQRCSCCNARLNGASLCPRCGADFGRALHCEHMANRWLSVCLQTLAEDHQDLAVAAVRRSLSFKHTPAARMMRDFLIHHQYQSLFDQISRKHWQEAQQSLIRLQRLGGESDALHRFSAMIEHLSSESSHTPRMSTDRSRRSG